MTQAPVELVEYNPSWPAKYAEEKEFLLRIAGGFQCGGIEHVGSTAVPGLVAKPVIDIMFGVASLEESRSAIDVISASGYQYWPYKADVMHWFCKPSDAFRTHHLIMIPFNSDLWHERIRFRDLLRNDAQLARRYGELKRELAIRFKEDREMYTREKWPFIRDALAAAPKTN